MSNDISKIGAAAIAALKALKAAKANKKSKTAKANELIEERNETARPLLQQVHDAIVAGQSVNGQSTWDGWAKHAGWSKRALNYILNGRKPQTGNSSSRKLLKELLDVINCAPDIHVIRVAGAMIMDEIGYQPKTTVEVDGTEYETDADRTISPTQFMKFYETIHIRFSPRKMLCQTRFVNRKLRGAIYAKKGEEATCPDCIAVRDKTLGEGTLQQAREKALAKKQPTTHKMQADGKRTWCGKTPGDTLAKDAPMSDIPTCRNCQNGENTDILRKTQVTVVVKDSNDAPVPYDTEAYAKAETWSQKRCIIGSPENLQWSADLKQRRELAAEIGEVGNLDGEDGNEEQL